MGNCFFRGVLHAYSSIARYEGLVGGLYRGTLANIVRNCIVNVGETVVYDASKDVLISRGYVQDGVLCHLLSAVIAGVSATLVASPVDVVKTRSFAFRKLILVAIFVKPTLGI